MFPKVKKVTTQYNSADCNERYRYQCPIVMRYLKNKLCGWDIGVFFDQIKVERIGLYAVTEFTEYVLQDLELSGYEVDVRCIGDRSYLRFPQGIRGKRVVSPEEIISLYHAGEIDKILICSVFHENAVIEDLMNRAVRQEDLIPVTSAVFSFDIYK